jgi:hypothetical protein
MGRSLSTSIFHILHFSEGQAQQVTKMYKVEVRSFGVTLPTFDRPI